MSKYRNALGKTRKETDAIVARMDELRDLLKEFGASLGGYDPGVTAYLPNKHRGVGYMGESLDFNHTEWAWLEPLLVELRGLRRMERTAKP